MKLFLVILGILLVSNVQADGTLSDDIRIESEALGYALQFRVYTPERMPRRERLPVLYFSGIAMQSPANSEMVDELRYQYMLREKLPLKLFMRVGIINDNTQACRQFMEALQFKEYDLTYREVNEGHDWANWKPLLDDVLHSFFARD